MVVNSTNETEISGLRFCDVDRFNVKSVKLIDDSFWVSLDTHHHCQVSHLNHILTSISFDRSHLTIVSEG